MQLLFDLLRYTWWYFYCKIVIETLHFLYHLTCRGLGFFKLTFLATVSSDYLQQHIFVFQSFASYLAWFNGWLNERRLACGSTSHCVNEPWKGQAHIIVWAVLIISSVSDTQPIYQKYAISISTDAECFIKTTYPLMYRQPIDSDPLPSASPLSYLLTVCVSK